MNTAHRLEFFTTDDGEPFACFVWGDVPPETITRERIAEAADYWQGLNLDEIDYDDRPARALWLQKMDSHPADDGDRYRFCAAGAAGAIRITGVRFL